jgi:tetratricopeptide (TPR) repeat protein
VERALDQTGMDLNKVCAYILCVTMTPSRQEHEPVAEATSSTRPQLPPAIPDHELLRKIGGGSYGEVWLARNILGGWRAVKIVYRNSFEHDRPFEREFAGIQRFEPISRTHESQVDILHVGRGEGYFYYIMELADDAGEDPKPERRNPKEIQNSNAEIQTPQRPVQTSDFEIPSSFVIGHSDSYVPHTLKLELQRRGRLPFEDVVQIGLALTTALAHLHKHGLVHRDIKPSNIIFVNGRAKLADIGLVTGVDETRSFVGTEGYLAPEGPGTAQADIYSLGKVLYEMSTGQDRRHFPALPAEIAQLSDQQQLSELNSVVVKACQHNPHWRYPSAESMQADLARLQAGRSVRRQRMLERRWAALKKVGFALATLALPAATVWLLLTAFHREAAKEEQPAQRPLTTSLDALNAYSDGRYEYNKRSDVDMTNAVRFFERAIALDPNFAQAYAGLASSYTWLDAPRNFHKAREPAEKALALNPNLPEAHKCLALIKYMLDWHWAEAEEEFKLAIRLDPRDGETLRAYGNYLKTMGRTSEAIKVLMHAHELDPRAISITEILGEAFFAAGDYAQALKQYQSLLDTEPTHQTTRWNMARVYEEQGLFLRAIDLDQEEHILWGEDRQAVARWCDALRGAYQAGGADAYWRKGLEWAKEDPTNGPFELAEYYAHFGDRQSTFQLLEEAYQKRAVPLVQGLKTSHALDKFRKDPEFIALLKKMKWE